MRPVGHLFVKGGNMHQLVLAHLTSFQEIVAGLGAETYPLFLRLGGQLHVQMQPVTSSALLAEIEQFSPRMAELTLPCLLFRDEQGQVLGGMYGRSDGQFALQGNGVSFSPTPEGIRVVLKMFPPPVGFRSLPSLASGHYECYFQRIIRGTGGDSGLRTPAMGGSGAPVPLPSIPVPPVTRWDFAHTAGRPSVTVIECVNSPVHEVFRDLLHSLVSACHESLRLKAPLQFRRD